jgi:hypothetical protein
LPARDESREVVVNPSKPATVVLDTVEKARV